MKNVQRTTHNARRITGATILFILTCAILPTQAQAAVGPNWIEQYGITWTFDKNISTDESPGTYQYGTFANGDYWVVGPVSIILITPITETIADIGLYGSWTKNGSMLNPVCSWYQGYDSRGNGTDARTHFDPALNVAMGVNESTPLAISNGSTLISTISQDTPDNWPQLKTAAVLTILATVPPQGSFRPALAGTDKTVKHNVSNLERGEHSYSYLSALAPVADTPSLSTVERWFERPWIETQKGWNAGRTFPSENMPKYGREISKQTSQAALMLNFDFTGGNPVLKNDDLKRTLLIRYVQLGIDLYGIVTSNTEALRLWQADGGIQHGRKLPILFAAFALDDEEMKSIFQKAGAYMHSFTDADGYANPYGTHNYDSWFLNPPDHIHFQEDDQVYYVTKFHVDATTNNVAGKTVNGINYTGFPSFAPDTRRPAATSYSINDIGLPEWSYRPAHRSNTSIAGPHWDYANYREEAGCSHPAIALAVHIMGLKTLWNHPALFDYADRYMRMIEDIDGVWGIKNDPSEPDWGDIIYWRQGANGVGSFVRNMWATYRADYGPSWKPDPSFPDWPATGSVLYGDLSGDGGVSLYDAALCLRIAVGLDPVGDEFQKADVSGDGQVSAYDAALIAQKAVGLRDKFPVEQ